MSAYTVATFGPGASTTPDKLRTKLVAHLASVVPAAFKPQHLEGISFPYIVREGRPRRQQCCAPPAVACCRKTASARMPCPRLRVQVMSSGASVPAGVPGKPQARAWILVAGQCHQGGLKRSGAAHSAAAIPDPPAARPQAACPPCSSPWPCGTTPTWPGSPPLGVPPTLPPSRRLRAHVRRAGRARPNKGLLDIEVCVQAVAGCCNLLVWPLTTIVLASAARPPLAPCSRDRAPGGHHGHRLC